LSTARTRHTPAIKQACDAYQTMQGTKTELENDKAQTRTALDQHTDQLIARYGQSINRYLERFNAGFSITTPTYTYRGGPPSSSYQIVINKTPVDLGDATTPLAQPSFKNTLSAGDKSTLALAFFLAQLEQDPDRGQKIAVLDDPFTSQDEFRRLNTIFEIKKLGADVKQVVLLSHDPHFLKQLWDRLQPDERKTIRLGRVGPKNTGIVPWDIEEALRSVHRANIEALLTFHNMAEGNTGAISPML
jgi:wobble nucleotide-excising tRNase